MGARWSENDGSRRIRATGSAMEEDIARLGTRQRQLVRIAQLVDLGLGPRGAQHRTAAGRLHRVHDGVFALHGPPYSPHQLYLAAHFACGSNSLLGGFCAASLFALVESMPRLPEIISPMGAGRARKGIRVRRTTVERRDRTTRHGIPCTTPARTIIDCAYRAGADGTEDLIMAADAARILDRRRFEQLADEHAGRPGIGNVLAVITDDPVELRNRSERRMFSICREVGVPLPHCNHRIDVPGRTFYADFCWPELRLIVEADSWRWHGGRRASERDADRDQLLAIAGWRVIHFTRDQIRYHRLEVGRRLIALTLAHTDPVA